VSVFQRVGSMKTATDVPTKSQLFTLRVWMEMMENGRYEMRGTLRHVLTGETYYFSDWQAMIRYVEVMAIPDLP